MSDTRNTQWVRIVLCKSCVSVFSCSERRWLILIDVRCLLCVSQLPSALIPTWGFMKPGGWSTAKLCGRGTAGLHSYPSSPLNSKKTKNFSSFHHCKCWVLSGPQITWGDRVEVFAQAAGLERDITPADEMFSQHAVLHACQQTMLLEGLLEPVYEDHIYTLRGHS